ncbi:MAG: mechanosensitive ion channel family protein [Anaerolineae bacterium]
METGAVEDDGSESGLFELDALVPNVADIVPTRTPVPTATPGLVVEGVEELVQETGLSGKTLLWLEYADWINLGISLLYVLIAYLIGTWLIRWLLPRLVRRTKTVLDDRLLQTSGSELRWLAVVVILGFSTNRLDFVSADVKTRLADTYFLLAMGLGSLMLWRLINLAAQQARDRADKAGQREGAESLITLFTWALRLIVIVFAVSLSLTYFGVNITGFAVFLGIVGVALSLASRDILADIISGAIILVDQPYRIGDRIDLPSIESWGNVVDIGMRSTKILTLNHRMMIVPNSQIGKDQIINYSYPDPAYYDSMEIVVAYDNDVDQVEQVLLEAVRSVEGVPREREIDIRLDKFTENQMVFTVGWWLASYEDFYTVHGRVSRAAIQALKEAGIILPYTKSRVSVEENSRE